jgi:hypothetical protein
MSFGGEGAKKASDQVQKKWQEEKAMAEKVKKEKTDDQVHPSTCRRIRELIHTCRIRELIQVWCLTVLSVRGCVVP